MSQVVTRGRVLAVVAVLGRVVMVSLAASAIGMNIGPSP
jgi:hypothetical protein